MTTLVYILFTVYVLIPIIFCDDIKRPYFKPVTLDCEDSSVNLTNYDAAELKFRYWIFPSGKLHTSNDVPPKCKRDNCWDIDPSGYNVTIYRIDDENFGAYFCVLVMNDYTVYTIRKGLNVDGPDYGDLVKKYTENAKIGGIAAAVLFVVVAGTCFLWNCRYNKRKSDMKRNNGNLTNLEMVRAYDNRGADMNEKL